MIVAPQLPDYIRYACICTHWVCLWLGPPFCWFDVPYCGTMPNRSSTPVTVYVAPPSKSNRTIGPAKRITT